MKKKLLYVSFVVLLVPCLAVAQSTRTWVSGVGDDANPCSRTAPCKTFTGALAKTTAGGEIDALDEGDFGPVTITGSVTIDGAGLGAITASGVNGIVVNAGSTDVVILRNLVINGLLGSSSTAGLNGVQFTGYGTLMIESCKIIGFGTNGISFQPTVSGTKLSVKDTNIGNITGAGINVTSGSVLLNGVHIDNAGKGVYNQGGAVNAGDIYLTNAHYGFDQNGAGSMNLDECAASNGFIGIWAQGGTTTINNCEVTHNTTGLSHTAGSLLSYGNNRVYGNSTNGAPTGTLTLN